MHHHSTSPWLRRLRPRLSRLTLLPLFSLFLLGAGILAGCDARYIELRPASARGDLGLLPRPDAGNPGDAGTGMNDASGTEVVVLQGILSGLNSYNATGTVSVVRLGDGVTHELRFSSDFNSAGVPGPVVVLTQRDVLGNGGIMEAQGDVNLGASATSGAQTFVLPPGAESPNYVWVYCLPFTVDTARAEMTAP